MTAVARPYKTLDCIFQSNILLHSIGRYYIKHCFKFADFPLKAANVVAERSFAERFLVRSYKIVEKSVL